MNMNSDPPFRSTAIIVDSRGRPGATFIGLRQPGQRVCFVMVRLNDSADCRGKRSSERSSPVSVVFIRKITYGPSRTERSEYIC